MGVVSVKIVTANPVLSPIARVLRTVLQTILAYGLALPTLIGGVGLTGTTAAKVSAIVAGLVLVASAVQNLLEHFNVIPTTGATAAALIGVALAPAASAASAAPAAPSEPSTVQSPFVGSSG